MAGLDLWRNGRNSPKSIFDLLSTDLEALNKEFWSENKGFLRPAADVLESEDAYTLRFDIPGLNKDEIEIETNGRNLTVSGERKTEQKSDKDNYHIVERTYGKFSRSFQLPDTANFENIDAKYENGVLTITVGKSELAKAKKIKVKN